MILMIVHVDYCYVIGNLDDIKKMVKEIENKGLKIKVTYNTKDYLSCEVLLNKDKTMAWLGQPHLMKRLETNYGALVKSNQQYRTPGTPNFGVVRTKENETKISDEEQKTYRSLIGSLLQLVKYSRPDIANAVRELSKCMDGASAGTYK